MKKYLSLLFVFSSSFYLQAAPMLLNYDEPAPDSYASREQRALPLGNGGIGASVFGGVEQERIQLNVKSLWSGGPSEKRPHYMGGNLPDKGRNGATLKDIRALFAAAKSKEAVALCRSLVGVADDAGNHIPVAIKSVDERVKNSPHLCELEKEYASMVLKLDDHVGLIMEELERQGIADNTLIIFTSDNGHETYYTNGARVRKPEQDQQGRRFNAWDSPYTSELAGD